MANVTEVGLSREQKLSRKDFGMCQKRWQYRLSGDSLTAVFSGLRSNRARRSTNMCMTTQMTRFHPKRTFWGLINVKFNQGVVKVTTSKIRRKRKIPDRQELE